MSLRYDRDQDQVVQNMVRTDQKHAWIRAPRKQFIALGHSLNNGNWSDNQRCGKILTDQAMKHFKTEQGKFESWSQW